MQDARLVLKLKMPNEINAQHFRKFLNRKNGHPIGMLNEYLLKIGLDFSFEELECMGQPPQVLYKYRVLVLNEHNGELLILRSLLCNWVFMKPFVYLQL